MDLFSCLNNAIYRSINEPIRKDPSFDERWHDEDKGIITAWEVGRQIATEDKKLAEKVKNGELPSLGFKGGHHIKLKNSNFKYGTFHYLAELQGLKNQDLNIDFLRDEGLSLLCTKTNMKTIFTTNTKKFKNA